MKCPACGGANFDWARSCDHCHASLPRKAAVRHRPTVTSDTPTVYSPGERSSPSSSDDQPPRERLDACVAKAKRDLSFAKGHPNYMCDVCGPSPYGHYVYSCLGAAHAAVAGVLAYRAPTPAATNRWGDLATLVNGVFAGTRDYDVSMLLANRLTELGGIDWRNVEPSQAELDEILQLAEQFVTLVVSSLAEDAPGPPVPDAPRAR
jgi:hypothetical protein